MPVPHKFFRKTQAFPIPLNMKLTFRVTIKYVFKNIVYMENKTGLNFIRITFWGFLHKL